MRSPAAQTQRHGKFRLAVRITLILLLVLTLAAMLLFASCEFAFCESGLREIDTEPTVDTSTEDTAGDIISVKPGYEYTPSDDHALPLLSANPWNSNLQFDNGMVYCINQGRPNRFNPETGYMVPVCPDPLCKGAGQCPLYSQAMNMIIRDNKAYYNMMMGTQTKNEITGKWDFEILDQAVVYDMKTGDYRALCERCHAVKNNYYVIGDVKYMFDYLDPEQPETSPYGLYRCDLKTDRHTLIKEFGAGQVPGILYVDDENIYYHVSLEIFRMSRSDPEDITKIITRGLINPYCDGEYFYAYYSSSAQKGIQRFDMNGQNWELLVEVTLHKPYDYRVTENYIYYRPNETRNYSGFTNAYTVGDFYRIPKDGGEPELVFDVTDEFTEKYAIYQFMPDGNYIYASYIRAEDQYESQYNDGSGDMMRINILTGEYDFITSE